MCAKHHRLAVNTQQATIWDMSLKFKDMVDYVMANRGDKTFRGYSEEQIIRMLYRGLQEQTLYYEQGLDGRIAGMVLATVNPEKKTIWVDEIIAENIGVVKRFAAKSKSNFPDYAIAAQRHGKTINYSTEKLYQKLV